MQNVKVTGSIISKSGVTLFFADGQSEIFPQDSWKTQDILDRVLPALAVPGCTGVDLDLSEFSIAKKIEQALNGAVKLNDNADGSISVEGKGKTVIKDVEALEQHITRAEAGEGAKGFANFLKKFSEIKRQHSGDELLQFMKGADLPIADDGSIIGYKILIETGNGVMVDPHTRKVAQRLGSLVIMPDSKVDDNRRQACSTGLHIAARSYIQGFWGGDERRLCLVKIQPKDVIAVPLRERIKMRVSAYHIVKVLSAEDGRAIAKGTDLMEHPSAHKQLEEAVGGDHTPIIERVDVGGQGEFKTVQINVSADRKARKASKVTKSISQKREGKVKAAVLKVAVSDVLTLKKLTKLHGDLSKKWDKTYIKKLIRAQKLLDKGDSLRTIAGKTGMDRDALAKNLVRPAKA